MAKAATFCSKALPTPFLRAFSDTYRSFKYHILFIATEEKEGYSCAKPRGSLPSDKARKITESPFFMCISIKFLAP
ncbi:Uncharacterised protein [Vibrio cholerae]|nr:Uncharacterised protein [Vibrio cholerae]